MPLSQPRLARLLFLRYQPTRCAGIAVVPTFDCSHRQGLVGATRDGGDEVLHPRQRKEGADDGEPFEEDEHRGEKGAEQNQKAVTLYAHADERPPQKDEGEPAEKARRPLEVARSDEELQRALGADGERDAGQEQNL